MGGVLFKGVGTLWGHIVCVVWFPNHTLLYVMCRRHNN